MLKVWGRLNSSNVQKVVLCLEELGLAYERTDAGMAFGIVNTPVYRALNPHGLVPTIDDDGFILWESNAIVRYLCARHAVGTLWPDDPKARADIDRWMDWQQTTFVGPVGVVFWGLVRSTGAPDHAAIAAAIQKAESAAEMLEERLADRDFISGRLFGMADFAIAPLVHRWLNMSFERKPRPNMTAYLARVMQRPSARKFLTLPLT